MPCEKPRQLFDLPPKPRAKPRKLMHVIDAGPGFDQMDRVRFECARCGHDSGWLLMKCDDAKRGVPCPKCNQQ